MLFKISGLRYKFCSFKFYLKSKFHIYNSIYKFVRCNTTFIIYEVFDNFNINILHYRNDILQSGKIYTFENIVWLQICSKN